MPIKNPLIWEGFYCLYQSIYKPGSVENYHSSRSGITSTLKQPTRTQRGSRYQCSYLVLLQVGFTSATRSHLVYGALLPHLLTLTETCVFRRFNFFSTFHRLAPSRRYLALWSVEPGLSSNDCSLAIIQSTDAWIIPILRKITSFFVNFFIRRRST